MASILDFSIRSLLSTVDLFLDASPYILFGIMVAGLLRMFLSTEYVAAHLGRGRFLPVIKAAILGIPVPLCSCGVLPAAVSIRKQGASRGATAAFLISTPESGVDSITVSWALLDPIMTIARPISAFATAITAGVLENVLGKQDEPGNVEPDRTCAVDGCCDGDDCDPVEHANHHSILEKLTGGLRYALGELWGDIAGWFAVGIVLAGIVTAAVPDDLLTSVLGGGIGTMVLMLMLGVPLYICATASTPIAAALILKGVSPGAALVFLLVGPATNITSLSVLSGLLGKRAVALYLGSITAVSILAGLAVDGIYVASGVNARAVVGEAGNLIPVPYQVAASIILLGFSIKPLLFSLRGWMTRMGSHVTKPAVAGCDCTGKQVS